MKFRLARHTNKLNELVSFYTNIIGLKFLGEFKNHSGYDGVFVGKANADWHLEFTQTIELVHHLFDEDDMLVFYPENNIEYEELLNRIECNNIKKVVAKNPYWRSNGTVVCDPDGYLVVISPLKIGVV